MADSFKVRRDQFITSNRGTLSDEYTFEKKELGSGTYGTVQLGIHKATGSKRAIKTIPKGRVKNIDRFQNEIEILKSLDHPNIIKLYETFEDSRNVYLVMELCTGGELFDRIIAKGHFTERDAAILMKQILSATVYCHRHNICHRDLKPENFLFQTPADDSNLKIIDFGLSRIFNEQTVMTTKAGTPYYVAPQVLEGRYDTACDCWSVGVILYILLCGYPPFYGDNDAQILERVRRGQYSFSGREWDSVSESAKDLIRHLLKLNPAERYTAEQAYQHPWIVNAAGGPAVNPISVETLNAMKNFRANEKLKRAALTLIAAQASESEILELRNIFLALDKNGDGCLTLAELTEGVQSMGHTPVQEELQRVLAGVDTDGSGSIDYTEFIAATLDRRLYLQEEKLWSAFRVFDKDGSGRITAQELREVLSRGNDVVDQRVAEEIIREVDTNGDGEIDFDEFITMMRNQSRRHQ
eukprot:GILJ01000202.1.p1 GENE.GILJ01000202.1~~GILJ01000202.1.p1  ORF type:complete len:469 (+),score=93.72 GILJ01000202.1:43-1449(+)